MSSHKNWFDATDEQLFEYYIEEYDNYIQTLPYHIQRKECISGLNRINRSDCWSCHDLEFEIEPGDICFFEYGHAFLNEAGYQHFGLVISIYNKKAFVVPMTSNKDAIRKAQKGAETNHLYDLGKIHGLDKQSVLFLNDCKHINTSRIISINAHLKPEGKMFQEIKSLLQEIIFS